MGWHFPEQSQGRIVSTPWVSVEASRQAGGGAGRRVRRMGPPLRNTRGRAGNTGRVECWQQLGGKGWGRGDPVEQICVPLEGGRQEKSIPSHSPSHVHRDSYCHCSTGYTASDSEGEKNPEMDGGDSWHNT